MNHNVNTYFLDTFDNYRPQRSWAKVMFLQASVILSTGGAVCGRETPRRADPPGPDTPPRTRHPPGPDPPGPDTPPLEADTPGTRHPPWEADPLPRKQTPAYGQRAAGTHPTEMHSC